MKLPITASVPNYNCKYNRLSIVFSDISQSFLQQMRHCTAPQFTLRLLVALIWISNCFFTALTWNYKLHYFQRCLHQIIVAHITMGNRAPSNLGHVIGIYLQYGEKQVVSVGIWKYSNSWSKDVEDSINWSKICVPLKMTTMPTWLGKLFLFRDV